MKMLYYTIPAVTVRRFLTFCIMSMAMVIGGKAYAQEVNVNNAVINVPAGVFMTTDGGVTLQNAGGMDNAGTVSIKGDWTNNANGLINNSSGTVVLNGANETIGGTNPTTFNNLTLQGTGVKTLAVNATVTTTLALNDRELFTGVNTVFVTNPSTGAVTWSTGFISSAPGGALSRVMASVSTYVYPVGAVGRFRPVEITPSVATSQTYSVRMANVDPNVEGFSRGTNDGTMTSINNQYYHQINRIAGTSPSDVAIYYNPGTDGAFSTLAHWQGAPRWENMAPVTTVSNFGLSGLRKSGWNNYSPFALAVSDATPPVITCPANITRQCNTSTAPAATGTATATDNLDPSPTITFTDVNSLGGCNGTGTITRTWRATDDAGNFSTCTQVITVIDNTAPVITSCPANQSISTTPGLCSGTTTYSATATDNCSSPTITYSPASGSTFPVGVTTVTTTATDGCGNTATCTFTVTVTDNQAPNAVCQNVTVQLNNTGNGSTTAAAVNNGSSDNCGVASLSLSQTAFTCANVGANTVTLTVTDVNGNTSTCTSTVTVQDNVAPVALCQNVTVQLDNTGNGSTTAAAVNNGSSDACGIATLTLSQTTFNCTNVNGGTAVNCPMDANYIATATNASSNPNGQTFTVLSSGLLEKIDVISFNPAQLRVRQFVSTNLATAFTGTILATSNVANGASNFPGFTTFTFPTPPALVAGQQYIFEVVGSGTVYHHIPGTYAGGTAVSPTNPTFTRDIPFKTYICPATNGVTLTVTDVNGNTSTCTSTVTVQDNVAPVATCQNVTVQLNASGNGSTTAAAVNNGSSDACGIASLTLNNTNFTCANVGANTVILTVTDVNANSNTCSATVTVQDNVAPVATCQNVTVQLNASGNGSTTAAAVNNGSTDNCGVASLSLNTSSFTCANVGANTVTLTVTDVNGNTSTCTATATVQDNIAPVAVCQNVTVQLNASGNGATTAAAVNNGSSDACGIASMTLNNSSFTCANVGSGNTVILTVTDVNGNSSTCASTVTVQDNVAPVATCQNVTVQLNASGNGSTTAAAVNNGSSDACGIASLTLNNSSFTCANVGSGNTVILTVTDVNGNSSTCSSTVTVQDNVAPVALCQNVTVQLNASGNGSTTAAAVNNGSSDACGIASLTLNNSSFTCANVGSGNTVILTVTDVNGNSSTCASTVTVQDNVAPVATCQNVTVQLNASGNGSTTAAAVNNGSSDACGIASMTLNNSSFTCANVGSGNTVILTVTDVNGNSSTCSSTVTVQDNIAPVAICQNVTVQLNASGNGSTTAAAVNNGSSDACGIASLTLNNSSFTCANVGSGNTVILTVTDVNGNSSTCSSTVTVQDNVAPVALCQNVTVQLNASGNGSTTAAAVNNGSSDACGIASMTLNNSSFTCANVGSGNTVILTVTDVNGNSSTCSSTVTVQDNVAPVALCQNLTLSLNSSGTASTTAAAVNNGSSDACGIANMTLSNSSFTCANQGNNTTVLTVTDVNGNTATCTATIYVQDITPPTALCQNITIQLNPAGNASITASQINNGSSDNCGIASMTVSPNAFTCANVGANTVTLTVTDNSTTGGGSISSANLIGHWTFEPGAETTDLTGNWGALQTFGGATISGGFLDVTGATQFAKAPTYSGPAITNKTLISWVSLDNLSVMTGSALTIDRIATDNFDAIVYGEQQPNRWMNGSSSFQRTQTPVPGFAETTPNQLVQMAITYQDLGGGNVNIRLYRNGALIGNYNDSPLGTWNAGDAEVWFGKRHGSGTTGPGQLDAKIYEARIYGRVLSQSELQSLVATANSSTCTATVTVQDVTPPTAVCRNVTVQLNASGNGSTTAAAVNNGSSDACGIASLSLSQTSFVCSEVGANTEILTVTDVNGNTSTCTTTITVQDNVAPVALCQNVTVQLNASGNGSTTAAAVNNGSSDACGIQSLSLSQTSFVCSEVGANTEVLTVTDVNGNTSTCSTTITVQDNVAPVALCQNVTVQLNSSGTGSITAAQVNNGSSDACGIQSLAVNPNTFNCSNVNPSATLSNLIISEYIEGSSNNKALEIYNGTGAAVNLSGYTIRLFTNGSGTSTNFALSGTVANGNVFVFAASGANPAILSQADQTTAAGIWNGDDAVALFQGSTMLDLIGQIGCDPGTRWDAGGNLRTEDRTIVRNSSVTTGVTTNPAGPCNSSSFTTLGTQWTGFPIDNSANLGTHTATSGNTVTLTVTDVNGNTSTCTATVTVQDNVAPVAQCQNVTVQLNASGNGSTTAAAVNNGSSDACGIASLSLSQTSFVCSEVGANTEILTVTDVNGNSSTCTTTITVQDNVAPVALCTSVTVQLNASGNGSTNTTAVNNGSSDACGIASLALSQSSFTCANVGPNTVVLTVTDVNGNSSTCSSTVTVQDNVPPVALCQNVTVQLDNTGNGSTTAAAVNNGSSDACGIASLSLSPTAFNCSNVNPPQPAELFISEYIEGSGNNKCIEIYNGTGAPVNMAAYELRMYFNGSTSAAVTVPLAGTVASGDVFVVCNSLAQPQFLAQADQVNASAGWYNGNDAVALWKNNTTIIDLVGVIGENPGSQWGAGANSTEDNTLVRNPNVLQGNTSGTPGFPSVATEWQGFPQDNSSNLGSHLFAGTNGVVLTVTDVNGNTSTCAAAVTVEDNVAPVAVCQDLTINIASTGSQAVAASSIDNGSSDACGIASLALNPDTFDCDDLGANTVTLTVTDVNGNSSTCTATVTVTNDPLLASASSPAFACGYNVSCNGSTNGSATVAATGGCLPYSYLWSDGQTTPTATNLGAGTYTVTVTDVNGTTTTASVTLTEPALLTSATTSPTYNGGWNVSCNGATDGSIDLSVNGGASCTAYTYNWSNGAATEDLSGIGAGTYSVTVTDANGCTTTSTITLTEPPLLETTLIPQVYQGGWNVSCNGACDGMVFANTTGGTPAYGFAWSNGATTQMVTGLCAGTYTVTVTDQNGCQTVNTITLTEPPLMTDAISAAVRNCGFNISCNGASDGSIDYAVTGGTPPYAYVWSNGATTEDISGLAAGTYSVTATDRNGCTTTETITLTEPALLEAEMTLSTYACGYNVSCNGSMDGSAIVSTTGGCPPYTYQWSTGGMGGTINGLPAIAVSVTVTDANGCQAFASDELTEPAPLVSSGVAATYVCGTNVSCNGASDGSIDLSVTGGATCLAYTYSWSNGATTEDVGGLSAGTYSVTITDANGCSTSSSFTLTEPALLVSGGVAATYVCGTNVSCNGASDGSINLTVSGGADCVAYTYNWSNGATTEDVSGLTAGTYGVTITDANGCSTSSSFTLTEPALLVSSGVAATYVCGTNVSCNGASDGSINLTVSGGADCVAYTYNWSNGATTEDVSGLTAGTYGVTITDANGCSTSSSFTLTEPALLVSSGVAATYVCGTNVSCNGASDGSINLTVSGGADCVAYTYNWSNGATTEDVSGLTAGTYGVTITDANGCSTSSSFTLTEPALLVSSGVAATYVCGTNVSCNGASDGSINLTVAGGADCVAYTYNWSNGATTEDVSGLTAGTYGVTITDANGCSTSSSFTLTEPALLVSSGVAATYVCGTNVSCNGASDGSINLTVTGGADCVAYTYTWSNGATTEDVSGLAAGNYGVTITDANGCSTSSSFTLTQPDELRVQSITAATYECGYNVSCNGASDGSIDLTPDGGADCVAYSYNWSNGAATEDLSGLTAGTYSVTVTDANGCSTTASITLTEPALLQSSGVAATYACGTNVSCNGANDGSIDLTVTGGASCRAYSYAWSNGATTEDVGGLTAGTYTVTVTDANGCSTTSTFTLTEPALLVSGGVAATYVCGTNVSCNGASDGSIDLTVSGGATCLPYGYSWSNGATTEDVSGLAAGTYTVTVTDANGCSTTSSFTLTEPAVLAKTNFSSPTFVCGHNISCNGASDGAINLDVTGGADCVAYTYQWSDGATTEDRTGLSAGTYSVTVTDANGCSFTDGITLTQPAPLALAVSSPVHACGYNVTCNGASDGIVMLTVQGGASCVAYTYQWSNGATTEDLTNVPAGTYAVTVTDANGCSATTSITLTQPAPLAITSTPAVTYTGGHHIRCHGESNGQFTVNWAGGASCTSGTATISGPVTRTQSGMGTTTFSGLPAGTYAITVTDANGCVATGSITLTQPAPVVADAGPDACVLYGYQTVNCTTLVGSQSGGVAPYAVRWNVGSSTGALVSSTSTVTVCPTVTTTYCYTVTDVNGCTHTDCMVVNVTDIRCGNNLQKVVICHVPPGNPNAATTLCLPAQAVGNHIPGHPGDYLGACNAGNPCTPAKNGGNEASSAAAATEGGNAELTAFPNPFSSTTTVRFSLPQDGAAELRVYSLTGEEIAVLFEGMAEANRQYELEWKPQGVSRGVYFAKLVTSQGEVMTMKLVLAD